LSRKPNTILKPGHLHHHACRSGQRSHRGSKAAQPQQPVAREALDRNGLVILASTLTKREQITNRLAPNTSPSTRQRSRLGQNAGSVFVGRWSAQPMGDYISGPNHTLPTGGMARVRGGLSVNDFVKLITVQQYSAQAMRTLGPKPRLLAEAEGLTAHAEAIRTRLQRRSRG
jgi:histidinol dehydrogenase